MRRRPSVLVVLAVATALLAACSGAPRPQTLKAGGGDNSDQIDNGPGSSAAPDALNPDGTPVTGAPGATGPGGTGVSAGGSGPGGAGTGGRTAGGGGTGGGGSGTGGGGALFNDANLFAANVNKRGITDTEIRLCGHAALIFAQAFDTRPEDINLYWDYLKRKGQKIHGRTVSGKYFDDRYDGPAAQQAAVDCSAEKPFLIIGGIGFDQIPNVRTWAEQNKELYLHHIAVGKGAEGLQYSFTMQPTVEETGTAFGEFISKHHAGKSIGIVYRNSGNWEPGRSAAKKVLQARGQRIVKETAVEKNQGAYSSQIVEMQQADGGKGAQVVFLWENALGAAEFIKQSHNQGYHPTFVVFPFQTSLDLLMEDAMRSPIQGLGTWPAYKPGGYGDAMGAAHNYDAELKRFEAAMAELRPGVKPNDILWQVWLGYKQLHDLFERCGRDCTRNRFAGLMINGYKSLIEPNCAIDFARGAGHRGAREFIALEAYKPGSTAYFRTTQWCSERMG